MDIDTPPQPRQVHIRMSEQCPVLIVGTTCGWIVTDKQPNFWPAYGPVEPILFVVDSDYNLTAVRMK